MKNKPEINDFRNKFEGTVELKPEKEMTCRCESRKEISGMVMPSLVTKAGWYCPVHGWVDYKKHPEIEDTEVPTHAVTQDGVGLTSSESTLTVLKDIIEHGSWKYLLEACEKLESEKKKGQVAITLQRLPNGEEPIGHPDYNFENNESLKRWTTFLIGNEEERLRYKAYLKKYGSISVKELDKFMEQEWFKRDDVEKVLDEVCKDPTRDQRTQTNIKMELKKRLLGEK